MGRHPYLELADEIDEALRLDDRLAKADLSGFSEAHRRRLRARKAELVSLARADRMTDEVEPSRPPEPAVILDRDERLAGMATLALTGAWVAESPAEANRLAIQWADAEPRWQYGHTRSVIRPYAERPTWWEVTVVLVPRTTTYRVRDA